MHGREADWKKFTKLKKVALERFCEKVLDESRKICDRENTTAHENYLALYEVIRKRDQELARIFDDHSRSRADLQLLGMYNFELVSDDDLSQFSEEIRSFVTWQNERDADDS
jgi:hypothetical protein